MPSSQQLPLHPCGYIIVRLFHMQYKNKNSTNCCLLCIPAAKVLLFFDITKLFRTKLQIPIFLDGYELRIE